MHSIDASTMNFGGVVQHTGPLDKHYWHFMIPPSGPTSGSKRCWKMEPTKNLDLENSLDLGIADAHTEAVLKIPTML